MGEIAHDRLHEYLDEGEEEKGQEGQVILTGICNRL